ncbi:unnamed protein product [Adineta steineri]|nr:unnamed protein product [Adineta steineri]
MSVARSHHTASTLTNGIVLVPGGNNTVYLNSAELYNPLTGTWTITGDISVARCYHTTSTLANGKVLVAGGSNGGILASTELY